LGVSRIGAFWLIFLGVALGVVCGLSAPNNPHLVEAVQELDIPLMDIPPRPPLRTQNDDVDFAEQLARARMASGQCARIEPFERFLQCLYSD
jgi:hypothetical protein